MPPIDAAATQVRHDSTVEPPGLATTEGILAHLRTQYTNVKDVERLPDSAAGLVWRVHFEPPDEITVIVKYAGDRTRSIKRMEYEFNLLKLLRRPEMWRGACLRSPQVHNLDATTHVLILDDVGRLPNLIASLTPGREPEAAVPIGEALGTYLARVHNIKGETVTLHPSLTRETPRLRSDGLRCFARLPDSAARFGYRDDYIREAAKIGERHMLQSTEALILGDFQLSKVLVAYDKPEILSMYMVDFDQSRLGPSAIDVGQMSAEILFLVARCDHGLGLGLLRAFLRAYRTNRKANVDAASVALSTAAHLFALIPEGTSLES